jgi:hypothetical protein
MRGIYRYGGVFTDVPFTESVTRHSREPDWVRGQRNLTLCQSLTCGAISAAISYGLAGFCGSFGGGERAEAYTPGAIGFQARSARCIMHLRPHDRAASPEAANPDRRTIRPGGPGAATAGTASSPTSLSSRSGSSG